MRCPEKTSHLPLVFPYLRCLLTCSQYIYSLVHIISASVWFLNLSNHFQTKKCVFGEVISAILAHQINAAWFILCLFWQTWGTWFDWFRKQDEVICVTWRTKWSQNPPEIDVEKRWLIISPSQLKRWFSVRSDWCVHYWFKLLHMCSQDGQIQSSLIHYKCGDDPYVSLYVSLAENGDVKQWETTICIWQPSERIDRLTTPPLKLSWSQFWKLLVIFTN